LPLSVTTPSTTSTVIDRLSSVDGDRHRLAGERDVLHGDAEVPGDAPAQQHFEGVAVGLVDDQTGELRAGLRYRRAGIQRSRGRRDGRHLSAERLKAIDGDADGIVRPCRDGGEGQADAGGGEEEARGHTDVQDAPPLINFERGDAALPAVVEAYA
jgi:hypothetical protein